MSEGRRGVGLRIVPQRGLTADRVWAALAEVRGAQGWVCMPNEVVRYRPDLTGPLIAAEVAGDARVSVHVRQGEQGWDVWLYEELPDGDLVAFDEARVATGEGIAHLDYSVYWHAVASGDDPVAVYRPFASRLTGWRSV